MTEYEQLSAAIESRIASDPQLRVLWKKIIHKTATLADSAKYSQLCAQIMGQKLAGEVLGLSDRESVCIQLLRNRYNDVNQVCELVMRSIDESAGIAMNPRQAAFPAERVQQLAHSLTDPTVPDETIKRRANTGAANVAVSFHDDFVDENAAFRSDAGYDCYITRVVGGASCPWCSGMAGRYKYDEKPEDMFRRHDNCTCIVTFEQGAFRQDVWSKRSWETPKTGAGAPPPTVFSQEQARRLEQQRLAEIRFNSSSIDNPGESGIIEDRRTGIILDTELYHGEVVHYVVTDERISHIEPLSIDLLDDANNQKLTQGCKELLDYIKKEPLGTEGSIVYKLNLEEIERYKSESLTSSITARYYTEKCIVIHNHPSDTLLSDSDLWRFYEHDEYVLLGAVGHNGSLYFVEKTSDYDPLGFWDYLEESKKDFPIQMTNADRVKYVEKVMKGAEEYGIKFYTKIYNESN